MMEYYLARERNNLMIHRKTVINLQNITMSERKLTQKNTYCMLPYI